MIIVNACSMIILHVSCRAGLMFGARQVGGAGGEAPGKKEGGLGAAKPPNV